MAFEIDYQSCQQGDWPDCWFMSAVAGLAFHRPAELADLLVERPDGAVDVTFPGRGPVTVRPPENASSRSNGTWAAAIEAAAGCFTDVHTTRVLNFGEGIELLTGHGRTGYVNLTGWGGFAPAYRVWSRTTWFIERVRAAGEAGKLMVLGGTDGKWRAPAYDWIIPQHCYSLLRFETDASVCRVRNPYGQDFSVPADRKRDGYGPGEFWLTPDELQSSFCGLTIED